MGEVSPPAVSVLMPVYNGCGGAARRGFPWRRHRAGAGPTDRSPFLRAAIESVLDQTMADLELLIVDDGSTDATPQVLQDYARRDGRIRVVRLERNLGVAAALNRGLKQCRAELVARQDADDLSTVSRLEVQKRFLEARPATALCGTGAYLINGEGKLMGELRHVCGCSEIRRFLAEEGCPFVHGSVMFRRQAVLAAGGYSEREEFRHAEDYELWVRLAGRCVLENVPDRCLYFHRHHDSKIGVVHRRAQELATQRIRELARQTLR